MAGKKPDPAGDTQLPVPPSTPSARDGLFAWFETCVKGTDLAKDTDSYNRIAAQMQQLSGLLPSN